MVDTFKVPEFLPLLEQIKAIFSEDLTTQQKNNYQCFVAWALKMPLLQQQLVGDNLTQEIKNNLIDLLSPVQNALTDIHFSISERAPFIDQLTDTINNFYLQFDLLPEARAKSTIIAEWQDVHGQGSIPPLLPLPHPAQWHVPATRGNDSNIFDTDDNVPWQYSDAPNLNVVANEKNTASEANQSSGKES